MVIDVKNVTVQYTLSNFREIGLKEYLIKKVKREIKTEHFTAVSLARDLTATLRSMKIYISEEQCSDTPKNLLQRNTRKYSNMQN